MISRRELLAVPLAVGSGVAIALLDSGPGWDDTGITAVLLVLAAFASSAVAGRRPLLWALLVGGWIPLVEIPRTGEPASLAAILFAAAGALAGYLLTRVVPDASRG